MECKDIEWATFLFNAIDDLDCDLLGYMTATYVFVFF
jgi:hypothetical protein